jgi:hypothetical protein
MPATITETTREAKLYTEIAELAQDAQNASAAATPRPITTCSTSPSSSPRRSAPMTGPATSTTASRPRSERSPAIRSSGGRWRA